MTRQFTAHELTADEVGRLTAAGESVGREAIVVRPNRDNSGITAMNEVLTSMPRTHKESKGGRFSFRGGEEHVPAPFAFEMRYGADPMAGEETGAGPDERVLSLQYFGGDDEIDQRLNRQLQDRYSDSRIERQPATFLTPQEGQHMAASTLGLRRYTLYPLKNSQLDEFTSDPTGAILSEMVGLGEDAQADADVAVQIMCRPAGIDWRDGVPGGIGLADQYGEGLDADERRVTEPLSTRDLRYFLNEPTRRVEGLWPWYVGGGILKQFDSEFTRDVYEYSPSKADKAVAKMLSDLDGRGWELYVRIVALSDDPDVATARVRMVSEMFDNFYEYRGRQNFLPVPFNGEDALQCAEEGFARKWPDESLVPQRIIKPQIEAACLTNVPEEQHVSTGKFRWALAKPGDGVPPGTPRFDFDAVDIDRSATKEEKQLALIESSGDDSPFWYGLGVRQGVEAGSYTDLRNPHMFLVGESGVGKTTFIANRKAQEFTRSCGGLHIDPNGDDTEEWMYEWPDDKPPEDCIYIDLSGEHERIPRFNFLEIPSYLERGTRQYNEFVEKLAEDIVDMIRAAGGTDKYMGSRMKRVAKNVLRAMVRVMDNWDVTATLFDFAAVCSSQENLSKFSESMPESELKYLRDRVHSHADLSDGDLDALAGRLDEWVLNPNVRELICARDPSFSVEDAVTEARHIFVQMSDSGTDVVKRMFGGALITRTYFAQRFHRPDHDFHMTCDEAQTVITASCDIENIMDQGRKFNYSVTLACQRPDSQFSDEIRSAVTGNAATTIAYGLGNGTEAGAVEDQFRGVDSSDLANMSKFRFYMATETEEGLETDGYLVEAFRAPSEAREMVADMNADGIENGQAVAADGGRSVAELQEASLDIYGTTVDDADLEASPFKGGGSGTSAAEGDAAGGSESGGQRATVAERQRLLCKATYDAALHDSEDGYAWVDFGDVHDRFNRYTGIDTTREQLASILHGTPEVNFDDRDGKQLQCTEDGWIRFMPGSDADSNDEEDNIKQTQGGASHKSLLQDAYDDLSLRGLEVDVEEQSGGADVDAVGRLRESFDPEIDPDNFGAYAEAVDTFREENADLAALTGLDDVTIEAESSTSGKPAATCQNLHKAHQTDRVCLFLARPEDADKVYGTLADPPYVRKREGGDVWLNSRKRLVCDDEYVLRPAGAERTRWWIRDGVLELYDSEGRGPHATIDPPESVFDDGASEAFPAVESDVPEDAIGEGEEYRYVARPWIPEVEFDGDVPDEDAWRLLVVSRDGEVTEYDTDNGDEGGEESEESDVWDRI